MAVKKWKILVLQAGDPWKMEGRQGFRLQFIDEFEEGEPLSITDITIDDVLLRGEFIQVPGIYEAKFQNKQVKQKNGNDISALVPVEVDFVGAPDLFKAITPKK